MKLSPFEKMSFWLFSRTNIPAGTPSRAKMFCTADPIPERSKVTVDGSEYIVLECYRAFGFGEDHLEVTLQ